MLGERLKKFRKEKRLTLKGLAEAISSSPGFISEIENNKKVPGSEFLISLKRIYDVDLNWLLSDEEEIKAKVDYSFEGGGGSVTAEQFPFKYYSETAKKIIRALPYLNEEDTEYVLKYVEERKLLAEIKKTS